MNIVYDQKKNRLKQAAGSAVSSVVQLDSLKIFIPKDFDKKLYLLVQDGTNTDMLDLTLVDKESNRLNDIYMVSANNNITCKSGKIDLCLIYFEEDYNMVTEKLNYNISFEGFLKSKYNRLLLDVSENIHNMYKEIEEMTNLNITIYKKLEEKVGD